MDFGVKEYRWSKRKAQKWADDHMYRISMELYPEDYKRNVISYRIVRIGGARVYAQEREVEKRSKELIIKSIENGRGTYRNSK
jgi:hypothetical protein